MIFRLSTTPGTTSCSRPGVEVLGVLADDDQIDALEPRRHARQVPHRPQVRVQIERLAQADVDAREALADGRADRSLERDLVSPDRCRASSAGSASPVRSKATTPANCRSQSIETPAASRIRSTASVTSGPMPSPGMSVIVWGISE